MGSAYTADSARRRALSTPSWRGPTSSSAPRRTRSCCTTRRSCSTTATSGRQRLPLTSRRTIFTDRPIQQHVTSPPLYLHACIAYVLSYPILNPNVNSLLVILPQN